MLFRRVNSQSSSAVEDPNMTNHLFSGYIDRCLALHHFNLDLERILDHHQEMDISEGKTTKRPYLIILY